MRKWIFYSVLASAGFVLPVAVMNVAHAEPVPDADASELEAGEAAPAPSGLDPIEDPTMQPAAEPEAAPTAERTPSAMVPEPVDEVTPSEPTAPDVAAPAPTRSGTEEYVVREGDTLGDIAREHLGSVEAWRRIAQLNGIDEPEKLVVGTRLKLPPKEEKGS
mgnify:CR=1 FL=1